MKKELCRCLWIAGDDPLCPVHGKHPDIAEKRRRIAMVASYLFWVAVVVLVIALLLVKP